MKYGFNVDAAEAVVPGMLPSTYMRMAQPTLFSDSEPGHAYRLDRAVFDHHLDSLTSRNETQGFELFCRGLCERLICPNLKPATGPEGGGDSKADTETFSVAEEIQSLCYIGTPEAGRERWAFAFSAKADWKAKARSDVTGLAATGRPWDKIIFVTSRYAPSKARAELEDALTKAHGVRVEIHDRTWILNSVLDGDHIDLAVDHLGVGERIVDPRPGPRDYKRTQELETLERSLKDPTAYDQREMERVNDALNAALLSRNLERPRIETDGRFDRAIRLADRFGSARQRIETRYERLWAAFYWFDDIDQLNEEFEEVASRAYETDDAEVHELASTLFQNLVNAVALGHATSEAFQLKTRRAALIAALERLASDRTRPNNALTARTTLLFAEASRAMIGNDKVAIAALWPRFSEVIRLAEGLSEYRADRLEPLVERFGVHAGRNPDYRQLVDDLAAFVAKRTGEARGGLIRLARANQLDIETDRMEVIRLLGRATRELAQREHLESQVEATYALAVAYRGAGLLWAARAAAMFSIATLFAESERESDISVTVVPALMLLAWIDAELRLLPEFLDVIRLLRGCREGLPLDVDSRARVDERLEEFDGVLAASLLHTPLEARALLTQLPGILHALGLTGSQVALLYALGHETLIEGDDPADDEPRWSAVLARWADQLPTDIRGRPFLTNADSRQVQTTRVAGMTVRVETPGTSAGLVAGQALLTIIEVVFATLLEAGVGAHAEAFDVRVIETSDIEMPFITFDELELSAVLSWPADAWPTAPNLEGAAYEVFVDFTIRLVLTTCVVKDAMGLFKTLFEEEALGERISAALASVNSRSRAFTSPVSRLSPWNALSVEDFPLTSDAPRQIGSGAKPDATVKAEPVMPDQHDWKQDHRRVEVRSVIDLPLWEKAGWTALMLGAGPAGVLPVMGFLFDDAELGRRIFTRWRDRFGEEDVGGAIRMSIIRDLPAAPSSHYALLLSPGVAFSIGAATTVVGTRLKTLEPQTDANLVRFLAAYEREKAYRLVPAFMGVSDEPEFFSDLGIIKRDLVVVRHDDIQESEVESLARRQIAGRTAM